MGTRRPGPIGCGRESRSVEDGTLARNFASTPGPLGACATRNPQTAARPQPPRPRREPGAIARLPALRRGAQGAEVQKLQRQLNARLMPAPKLAVDGIFGPITQRAVVDYQKAMSIDADGIVGKLTWYHLLKGDKATVRKPEPVAVHAHPGTPTAAAPVPAPPPAPKPGVWEWPLEEKFAEALRRTAPKLDDSVREEFKTLLTPGALAMMAGTLVVWAASHAFGVGAVVDVLLLLTGIVFLGIAAFDVAEDLGDFVLITSTASSDTELEQASTHLSRAIAVMGVAAFMALLAKVAAKGRAPRVEAPKPQSAQFTSPKSRPATPKKPAVEPEGPKKDTFILDTHGTPIGARKGVPRPGLPAKKLSEEGWPDLPAVETRNFNTVEAVTLKEGTKIYRVIDDPAKSAGGYWTDKLPANRAEWRSDYAVKNDWNTNGQYVEYTVPKEGLKVWKGEAAPQRLQGSEYYLPGGGQQVWMPPGSIQPSPPRPTGW